MLVVDPKNRWKIDQVCAELFKMKSEISMMETSLDPTSEPMYHIGATLNVAEQEVNSPTTHG